MAERLCVRNLASLIFDLEMADRRLPEHPDFGGDPEEWRSLRALVPKLTELAKELKRDQEAHKD